MSTMAKFLRLALSASNKVVQSHSKLQLAHNPLLSLRSCQTALQRQLSAAVVSPHRRRASPTLTAVKSCTCVPGRLLQTEVDKELSKFLDKEINYEETASGKMQVSKGVAGFEVSTDDADVTLTRKAGSETVVVKFSINASVDADAPPEAVQSGEEEPEMVSKPPFTVEICKGDGNTLSMQCMFVSEADADQGSQDAEAIVDSFEIQEVSLHRGEWKETVYSVSADIMDGNLYDLMMDLLDERGINDEFASQLVDYSTGYEHARYLSFLKDLKAFSEK